MLLSKSLKRSVCDRAILTNLFLATDTVVWLSLASRRSCCIDLTEVPEYLATTVSLESFSRWLISATTSVFLSLLKAIRKTFLILQILLTYQFVNLLKDIKIFGACDSQRHGRG